VIAQKLSDNVNYNIYNEFIICFSLKMMNVSTPSWNGHDFYKGQTMFMVQKIVCHAMFPDDKTCYLVEWVNWPPFSLHG